MAEFVIALNQNGEEVDIDKADKQEQYYCVNCGQEMIPVQGDKRERHYQHKVENTHCNYNKWLHDRIVVTLYERLAGGDLLKIECPNHTYVDNEKASVEKEKQYGSFRPDILLKKEDDVYFIEIYVSHPCEKPKIASGIRIIEIKPANERAEQELISGDMILSKGNNYSIEYYNFPELTTSYDFIHNLHLSYVVMHKDKRLEVYGKDTLVIRNSDLLLLAVDAQPDFAMEIGKAYAFKKGLLDEADLSANELRLDIPAIVKYLNMINIPISQ